MSADRDRLDPTLVALRPIDPEDRKRLLTKDMEAAEKRRQERKEEAEKARQAAEREVTQKAEREAAQKAEREAAQWEAAREERKAAALRDGPATRIEEEAGLRELGRLAPEKAAARLHKARQLLADLEDPEGQDVAYDYLRARASGALREAWADWKTVGDFVRAHFPPLHGGRSPYGPDGLLRTADVEAMDLNTRTLVAGMIPTASVGIVTAPYGMGKTFASIGLGLSIAYGESWLDLEVNEAGPVRFVAAEGKAAFPKRLAGWLVHYGHLPETFTREDLAEVLEGCVRLTDGTLRLDDPNLERTLIRTCEEEGTRLLVLDTLGRLLGAEQSDSDNDTANRVMGVLSNVASETGATVLLVHHPGHSGDRSRGASAWEQAADFVFRVKGTRADAKASRTLILRTDKQKDLEYGEDVGFRLRTVTAECDGETWKTAAVEAGPIRPVVPLSERIRSVVREHPGSTLRFVRNVVDGRSTEIGEAIDRLIAAGRLEDKGKGTGYKLHDVPEAWPEEPTFDADPDADLSLADVPGEVDDSAATEA